MTDLRFASWVEPVASQMRDSRRQVIDFARYAPSEIWDRPSASEGWTYKDLLAHLAGGNDQMLQDILHTVVARQPLDPKVLEPDTDGENSRRVAERRSWSIEQLIETLERDGADMQDLLSRLQEADKVIHPGGASWSLEGLFHVVHEENHDIEHLTQLRMAYARPATHDFAPWVEPVAARLRASRAEIAHFARSVPADRWALPSPNPRWSNKDLLAHLATAHWFIQENLRRITEAEAYVASFQWPSDPNVDIVDWGNWERVDERRDWPVGRLFSEAEKVGERTQVLLARLTPEQEHFRREGAPRTLGENLAQFPNHEYFHLTQLRRSTEVCDV